LLSNKNDTLGSNSATFLFQKLRKPALHDEQDPGLEALYFCGL
jgi:hypothetical protein